MGCNVVHGETLLRVHVLHVSPFHKSIIELAMDSERERVSRGSFTCCSSVHGDYAAWGWIWNLSFAVLSYSWEKLNLQVYSWHYLQVGDSNLPYTCLCLFDWLEIFGVYSQVITIWFSSIRFKSRKQGLIICLKIPFRSYKVDIDINYNHIYPSLKKTINFFMHSVNFNRSTEMGHVQ